LDLNIAIPTIVRRSLNNQEKLITSTFPDVIVEDYDALSSPLFINISTKYAMSLNNECQFSTEN
jgi:hypothetical protein